MKMNINKYKLIRLFLIIKGFLLFPLIFAIPRNKKRIIFCSTSNLRYNYNSKYLFEYFLKTYPEYEIRYVLNNKRLKKKLERKIGDYFITTESLKDIIYCLKAYTWITSSLETPIGGFYLKYNRLVIHLGHGTPFKNIGFLEKKLSLIKKIYYTLIKNNFSYILATSENFVGTMQKFLKVSSNRIFVSGQPRNDSIFINKKDFLIERFSSDKKDKNILYAPTWRQKKETILFPFDDINYKELENFLEKNEINIFLRIHPSFELEVNQELLNLKRVYLLNSKLVEDITEYLSCFDFLITDYSSIFIDYLLLNRPILFFPYDYEEYKKEIGFTVDFNEHTPGPKVYSLKIFQEEINKYLKNSNYYIKEREKENNFFNSCRDKTNCKKVAEFIIKKL